MMRALLLFTVVSLGLTIGCVAPSMTADLGRAEITPPSLMVARNAQAPLYIVIDDAKLPNRMRIQNSGGAKVTGLQLFASRDLKRAFESYFERVEVAYSPDEIPSGEPSYIADVKIDSAGVSGSGALTRATLTWGFGLRARGADDYLFSYAGKNEALNDGGTKDVLERLFGRAITDLLSGYTDKEVHEKLLQVEAKQVPDRPEPAETVTL